MSEFENENVVIMHSFEKDGEIHPPVCAECSMCSYVVSRIVGFDFGGDVEQVKCGSDYGDKYLDDSCSSFDFDESKMSEDQQEEYDRLKELGQAIDYEKDIRMNEEQFLEWKNN